MPSLFRAMLLVVLTSAITNAAVLTPTDLRCEYRTDPLGIGVDKPRLSWILKTDDPAERGQAQSAYHILVASSAENLKKDQGDLWDTKKAKSDETIQIIYVGKPLSPGQRAYWKVRTWNAKDKESDWSEPAMWSLGVTAKDWKAKWIGYNAKADDSSAAPDDKTLSMAGLKWIWTSEGDATKEVPAATRYFARKISIPVKAKIRLAQLLITVDDNCKVIINGKTAGSATNFKAASVLDITPFVRTGGNTFQIEATNGRGPAGLIGRVIVWLKDAKEPLTVDIDRTWGFAKAKPFGWDEGNIDMMAFTPSKEAAAAGEGPWGMPTRNALELPPPPYMRKTFAADKPIKQATLYVTARGLYELRLNGERVGEDELTPGWTDYNKRIYFQTYDVTPMIKQGENRIGAILGDGWHSGYFSYQGKRNLYGSDPSLLVQLEIVFADGKKQTVMSDESWKCAYGPIREADLLMGSAYDARKEIEGWDKVQFDDAKWAPAEVAEPPKAPIEAYPGNLPRRHEEIRAKKLGEPSKGVYVFDLGQNIVGWARLAVRGEKAGTRIQLRHSEMLNPDGTPYTIALRGARAIDTFYPRDEKEQTFEPKFTFHGFRYVEVTGLSTKPKPEDLTGIVVHAEMPRTGEFECSNKNVNQLFHNIIWGQKGNYLEVPTDCPQRDERLGWTGDAQFFIRTGAYNFDISAFFTKWLVDLVQDSQHADGTFADVAPDLLGGHGNVAWGDAGIICPYVISQYYNDTRVIEKHYANMAKYIAFLEKDNKDFIRGFGAYGDWLNLDDKTKPEVIGTAYFHHVARLMSEMAARIGKSDDEKRYAKLAADVRDAFIKNFINEDGSIKESGQTGYALAFTMNLIPSEKRAAAADHFVKAIERKNNHLATGFIGTPRLLPALTFAGKTDVAYRLFLTETYPSWLYQVTLGATTMWERWDGWTPDRGFQDPGMNSFNHYAFGSVGEWMYRTVAGIDTDGPGFKKIILKPTPGAGVDFARASYKSIRGEIKSEWKLDGDTLTAKFVVPPNVTATAYIPTKDAASITESGKPAKESSGVQFLWTEGGYAAYRVGSGVYEFTAKR